jgi:undecaprenyl-diphosphatase
MIPTPSFDLDLLFLLNQEWRSGLLDFLLPWFSSRAALFTIMAGLIVWRSMRRGKGQVLYFLLLVLAMGAADLTCNAIKHGVGRVRPEHSIAGTWRMESGAWQRLPDDFKPAKEEGTSFPSAHAANSAALVTLAMFLWPRVRRGLWALPIAVGWSRLYLGKHFPTDVIFGWLLGLAIGYLFWLLWRFAAERCGLTLLPEESDSPYLLPPPGHCR